jgi:hypothetical protein
VIFSKKVPQPLYFSGFYLPDNVRFTKKLVEFIIVSNSPPPSIVLLQLLAAGGVMTTGE